METIYAGARGVAIIVGGSTLVVAGVACIVLPGPGIPLIFAGLAVLGTRLPWARRTHQWMRQRLRGTVSALVTRIRPARVEAGPSAQP